MLVELVDDHAAAHPDRLAIVAGDERLTYGELQDRSLRWAAGLQRCGIGPGRLVALYLPRIAEAVACMLGVLRAGACYTLIEDDQDTAGAMRRLAAAGADLTLTTRERCNDGGEAMAALGGRVETLDALRGRGASAGDTGSRPTGPAGGAAEVAYVLYTSGSTGEPKGVAVTHHNIQHYVESLVDRLGIVEAMAYAHVSTLSADLGNTCLFVPLWTGGTIHLVDDGVRKDGAGLMRYLRIAGVDFLKITPSHWSAVAQGRDAPHGRDPLLRYLVLGGERVCTRLARDTWRSGVTRVLVNHYGPTETTVGVVANVITDEVQLPSDDQGSVPIGYPLGDTTLLVHDRESGAYRAAAATGELYVGGPSVAVGYRGDPTATAAAFRTDIIAGQRFYRTGDLVRVSREGEVTFLGRTDRQVKISGYRVDLGHVETVLTGLPGVRDAACCQVERRGRSQLLAAVVAEAAVAEADLLTALRTQQPPYLVPQRIAILDELPRTPNGKTDLRRVGEMVAGDAAGASLRRGDGSMVAYVRRLFGRYLGRDDFTVDEDFFHLGGNSIDAIQIVSDLQVAGHDVTANTFLRHCTVAALAAWLEQPAPVPGGRAPVSAGLTSTQLSDAQRWFFEQRFSDPDHWNQALLLEAAGRVDPSLLRSAVQEVVGRHPLLRTSYRFEEGRWRAAAEGSMDRCFSVSRCPDRSETGLAGHVRATARRLQAGVDLAQGRVFRAHLCHAPHHRDHLLLIAHHLSVDAVSWRIIVADIVRVYGALARGERQCPPRPSCTYWDWVRDTAGQPSRSEARPAPRVRDAGASGTLPMANTERTARTVWLALSSDETSLLSTRLPQELGVSLHAALLGAFLQVLAAHRDRRRFDVDVETHGRTTSPEIDVSRVVGWFTAMHQVTLEVSDDLHDTLRGVDTRLQGLSDRGGVVERRHASPEEEGPLLCFNHLGQFHFPQDDALQLEPSRLPIGATRGDRNDRVHDYKLTARTVTGHLVVDLSFSEERDGEDDMRRILDEVEGLLLGLVGGSGAGGRGRRSLVEPGSTTGQLCYVPRALELDPPVRPRRSYRAVLLTGATGFLGAHLLHQLLATTQAHVYCLVRGRAGVTPDQRLRTVHQWHFPHRPLGAYEGRYTVVPGDLCRDRLGTSPRMYRELCSAVDAIYHLAGDTRLFGHWQSFHDANVVATQALIRLANLTRPKDLHFVSTLAVCGTGPVGEAAVFGEDDLDIGQQFLNDYERTKYLAESLVRRHVAEGRVGFVYRCGNVTGHSHSGRFQRNATDNRFVQELRALLAAGRAPGRLDDQVVLSPVDVVARGILALSQRADITSGTFHVDGEPAVPYSSVFDTLRHLGFELRPTDHADIATLLAEHSADQSADIQLGYFWARRPPRNVRVDRSRTLRLLREEEIAFPVLDERWLRRFLLHLVDQGAIQQFRHQPAA